MLRVYLVNEILYFSNSYYTEFDNDLISKLQLDISEEVEFNFQNINLNIQSEIKFLFNYHPHFDGEDFSFEFLINKDLTDFLNGWEICFEHFVNTFWKDRREEIIKVCIDYAETCLYFHRQTCPFCEEFGDCSATSIWKTRISFSANLLDRINKGSADNILLKYENITIENANRSSKSILKSTCIDKVVETLKEYFHEDEQELRKVLTSNITPNQKLVFNSKATILCDFFKQLFNNKYTVGTKKDLKNFIYETFQYKKGKTISDFSPKYIENLLTSTEITCKGSITDVKKWE